MKLSAKMRYHEYILVYKDMLHIKHISHCQFENVKIVRASSGWHLYDKENTSLLHNDTQFIFEFDFSLPFKVSLFS